MKRSSTHIAMSSLKTVCNGWCTSHRMHDDTVLSCVFGCSERDTLAHYFACPVFWALIDEELGTQSDCAAHRLGLHQVSGLTVRALFLASHIYQAVKVGRRGVSVTSLEVSDNFSYNYSCPVFGQGSSGHHWPKTLRTVAPDRAWI